MRSAKFFELLNVVEVKGILFSDLESYVEQI